MMATPFHLPVTAAQVGTYFIGQYYQILQQQPDFVHQFYSEASTMLRVDAGQREAASGMLQIHTLIMSLRYTGIEIKTANSLESWNGGVLVVVSGSVHVKDYAARRRFVQTFFLAPQQKGYFVQNDIFHFVEEEQFIHHPINYLHQNNLDAKLSASAGVQEQVSNYMMSEEIQSREFAASVNIEGNGPANDYGFSEEQHYSYPEERLQQVPAAEKTFEDRFSLLPNGSLQSSMNTMQEQLSATVDEPAGEPQKHTYASIVAKRQPTPTASSQSASGKAAPPSVEWQHIVEAPSQPLVSPSDSVERSGMDFLEEASAFDDEGEVKSVYVRNVPTTMAASEIEEEFKKFGKLSSEGVAIRTRKDIDVCYAFVEFEDVTGVQNAIKASTVQIAGHQLYIEARRPNRNYYPRGGRGMVRGRFSYQTEGARGRFGVRGFSRGIGQDVVDRDYNRPRGNGFHRQALRQEREFSGN